MSSVPGCWRTPATAPRRPTESPGRCPGGRRAGRLRRPPRARGIRRSPRLAVREGRSKPRLLVAPPCGASAAARACGSRSSTSAVIASKRSRALPSAFATVRAGSHLPIPFRAPSTRPISASSLIRGAAPHGFAQSASRARVGRHVPSGGRPPRDPASAETANRAPSGPRSSPGSGPRSGRSGATRGELGPRAIYARRRARGTCASWRRPRNRPGRERGLLLDPRIWDDLPWPALHRGAVGHLHPSGSTCLPGGSQSSWDARRLTIGR